MIRSRRSLYIVLIVTVLFLFAALLFVSSSRDTAHAQSTATPITGYAWSDTIGWISLNCSNLGTCGTNNYGLSVDASGNISGYAWSDNVGWISANTADLTGCPSGTCAAKITNGSVTGWLKTLSATAPQSVGTQQTIYLTSGTSWPVPSDWNNSNNTIEVIGGGGGGVSDFYGMADGGNGGGGGAYAKAANVTLTPGGSVAYAVGSAGAGDTTGTGAGGAGGDTYFCSSSSGCASIGGSAVVAGSKGGAGGFVGENAAPGGASAGGVGVTKYSGGNGGNWYDYGGCGYFNGGGGGGAAGPHGNGNNGVTPTNLADGGAGGSGDAGFGGAAGAAGGDGAGGGAGGNGTEWDSSHGAGGGGGGGGADCAIKIAGNGAAGGSYGAGGGGSGYEDSDGNGGVGGSGAPGIIVIKYTPSVPSQSGGWDGWISLSGSSPSYGPTIGTNGNMNGYAWGSDVVGWVDFSFANTTYGTDVCPNIPGNQPTIPTGYTLSGGSCVNYCTPQSYCTGNDLHQNTIQSNVCVSSFVQTCSYQCANGACVVPPSPDFQSFSATSNSGPAFTATGHLLAKPSLVRSGDTTHIYWDVINTTSCTVAGGNDTWTVAGNSGNNWTSSSGAAGEQTGAIARQTVYTLTCQALPSATPPSITETVTVNVAPIFQEK